MDGLAYWLFIAALYFLSSLMKRRQQKFARNKLEREDIDPDDSDFIDNKTAPESMDDFFDQLRNYGKDFLDFEEEDYDDQYSSEDEEKIDHEVIIEEPTEDKSRAVFEDLSKEKLEPTHQEYRITKKQDQNISSLVNSILSDNNKVKKAIILKEIFDKPRALRRSMR